jgi:membrane protease YdiL (CAAX protease family)
MSTLHTDPSRDLRRLAIYFSVLVAVYAAAVTAFWSTPQRELMFLLVMFAPTVGVLAARFTGPGVIQWGRPSWWILAGLIPAIVGLGAYTVGAAAGLASADVPTLLAALVSAPLAIFLSALAAMGEEIGWRGFLWLLTRSRRSFLISSLIVGVIWWLYHLSRERKGPTR